MTAEAPSPFDDLEATVRRFSKVELKEAILECGVIPEAFGHDSSEEKLWAKVCDVLLAMALTSLGVEAEVIRARGNSADVLGKAGGYTLVGDAKAFRLSRTAKNQKDFKVSALDDWRRKNTYACIVGPLKQFPNTNSQIYEQAIGRNVTLLSYTHIRFLLDHGARDDLAHLWVVGKRLPLSGRAEPYWEAIDSAVLASGKGTAKDLHTTKEREVEKIRELGDEGIKYWTNKIAEYRKLSRDAAIAKLIRAEKIVEKIETIKRAIA